MTARQWRAIGSEQAKLHPLYGVKNWLAVFALGILLSGLRDLGALNSEAHNAGMTIGQLLSIEHPAIAYTKIALLLNAALVAIIYWLLLSKHPRFRPIASSVLLCSWPAAALIGAVNPFQGLGSALAMSLLPWAISCAVWVTYLQRSQRVRVTFEHCVLTGEATTIHPQATVRTVSIPDTQASSTVAMPVRIATTVPAKRPEVPAVMPLEEFWSEALIEFEGASRRPGLWARAFAEAQGNEPIAKASYLRHRAEELQQQHAARLEQGRRDAEAKERAAALAHLSAKQREYAELPKGVCPGCDTIVPLSAEPCPNCGAMFGPGSAWKLRPIDESEQLEMLRALYLSGRKLTVDELIFLARASSHHSSLVTLSDRDRGNTLLHWAAKLGLQREASLLIANGANAATPNGNGQKPFELAENLELRDVLRAAV